MVLTPLQRYQQDLTKDGFVHDPTQEMAIRKLQNLYDRLVANHAAQHSLKAKVGRIFGKKIEVERGLYFWGGVGRGKTYLMDTFFDCLPFDEKMRVHFHHFMQRVQRRLTELSGEKNPLDRIADEWGQTTRIICFDEFFVSDIGDAMILATLLEKLFDRGVSLVTTSNIVPDGLYKDGLQRARFLPAIELIKKHTEVLNVDGGTDYRLRALEQAELFHYPLDAQADQSLMTSFKSLVPDIAEVREGGNIKINDRKIATVQVCEDVIWFDYKELCLGPRSSNDFIEIAREFATILLANVPQMGTKNDDGARRFVNMVDEFYDRNVKLIISADVPLQDLYSTGRLEFEFQRTVSRLLEMQSREYLALPHRA